MITALLIDDDSNLRNGMKGLLAMYAPDIKILGEADSVKGGITAIETHNPDVIFLDIQLGDGTGFDILEQLTQKRYLMAWSVPFCTMKLDMEPRQLNTKCGFICR